MDKTEELNKLEHRNKTFIELLLFKFKTNYSYEQLITEFTTVYLQEEPKLNRIRLMGVQQKGRTQTIEEVDNAKPKKRIPAKRVQIYAIKKTEYEKLTQEEIQNKIEYLTLFVSLIRQAQAIRQAIEYEDLFKEKNFFDMLVKYQID